MAAFPDFGPELGAHSLVAAAECIDDRADHAAFSFLYERHAGRVHRFVRDLLGDATLAHDATQETFARAFRDHRDILRDRERAVPWLFGIARNVARELRKARARASRIADHDPTAGELSRGTPASSPEANALGREAAHVVDLALGRLSEDRRAMLLLRFDHGLAYDDIAQLMGFSLAKVKIEIHRAREVLRQTFDEYRRGERVEKGDAR